MSTRLSPLFWILFLILNSSCNFNENIVINEDGSGSAKLEMEGAQMMTMAGKDIVNQVGSEKVDSTFNFKQFYSKNKDRIMKLPKEQQQRIMAMGDVTAKLRMNIKTTEFNVDVTNKFKNTSEIKDMMSCLFEMLNINKDGAYRPDYKSPLKSKTKVHYSYDGNKFVRKVTPLENLVVSDTLERYLRFFKNSQYSLNYKFPKKIKSVSNQAAVISEDKKSLTLSFLLSDYYRDPKNMSLEVAFE